MKIETCNKCGLCQNCQAVEDAFEMIGVFVNEMDQALSTLDVLLNSPATDAGQKVKIKNNQWRLLMMRGWVEELELKT